jgi:hypothetical protein
MGSAGFFILYFAAGIFGNVLGANFALLGSPSTGASGAIFGTVRTIVLPSAPYLTGHADQVAVEWVRNFLHQDQGGASADGACYRWT